MEITDATRAAVLAERCEEVGHEFSMQNVITGNGMTIDNQVIMRLGNQSERAPHIYCGRCSRTWLVVEVGALGYDTAEGDLIARLAEGDALRDKLSERRFRRVAGVEAETAPAIEPQAPVA